MNVEFHYYTTYFLAVKAGFSPKNAQILSYSSQYVDNNLRSWAVETPEGAYSTFPSQTFTYWQNSAVKNVYFPFHFFPAGKDAVPSVRQDGKTNFFDVRPNSQGVKELLVAALKSKNLYRIGIALHTFADTWAHQNFSGLQEKWNRLDENSVIPSAGHAQAGWTPDQWLTVWEDSRLSSPRVDNKSRFLACAEKIYRYLCTFNKKDFHEDQAFVLYELGELVEAGRGRAETQERMLDFLIWGTMDPYDKDLWLQQAVVVPQEARSEVAFPGWDKILEFKDHFLERTGLGGKTKVAARPDFRSSSFFLWQEASREQFREAWAILNRLVPEAGKV